MVLGQPFAEFSGSFSSGNSAVAATSTAAIDLTRPTATAVVGPIGTPHTSDEGLSAWL